MRYDYESISDWSRPGLPMTVSGITQQGNCGNYATAEHSENKRRKASAEVEESVERETLTHRGGYLKYRNNDLKGKRAGRYDGAKECRHTVPTGNKVER